MNAGFGSKEFAEMDLEAGIVIPLLETSPELVVIVIWN